MIRLKEAGKRGGELIVTMTPFDLISLEEGLSSAITHLEHLKKEHTESWEVLAFEPKLNDAKANFRELERVRTDRENILEGK